VGNLQLPQGPQSDSYQIYLSVNIVDDTNGVTTYSLPSPVVVLPNTNLLSDPSSNVQLMTELNSGNVNLVARNAIAIASGLNMQFDSPQTSTSQISEVTAFKELLVNKVTQLSVSDSNSISTIASTLSSLTQVPNQVSSNMAVNYFFLLFKKSISCKNHLEGKFLGKSSKRNSNYNQRLADKKKILVKNELCLKKLIKSKTF